MEIQRDELSVCQGWVLSRSEKKSNVAKMPSEKKKGYLRFGTFVKENMFKVLVSPLEVPRARLDGAWGNLV